jgi:hypothetical protein
MLILELSMLKKQIIILILLSLFLFACVGSSMYVRLDSTVGLQNYTGKRVELSGRISATPWQHLMVTPESFRYSCYFDVSGDQIVIYTKQELICSGELSVRGTVVKAQGPPKKAGSKADESWVEYQIEVDDWECR